MKPELTVPLFAFKAVTAHGICHLLGYRHETEEEWTEVCMKKNVLIHI